MFFLVEVPEGHRPTMDSEHLQILGRMCQVAENAMEDEFILFPDIFDPAFLRPSEAEEGLVRGIYCYDAVRGIMEECCGGDYVDVDNEIDLLVKSFGEKAPLFD